MYNLLYSRYFPKLAFFLFAQTVSRYKKQAIEYLFTLAVGDLGMRNKWIYKLSDSLEKISG